MKFNDIFRAYMMLIFVMVIIIVIASQKHFSVIY